MLHILFLSKINSLLHNLNMIELTLQPLESNLKLILKAASILPKSLYKWLNLIVICSQFHLWYLVIFVLNCPCSAFIKRDEHINLFWSFDFYPCVNLFLFSFFFLMSFMFIEIKLLHLM